MKRLFASGLALAFAVLVVATFARTPAAQTGPRLLDACEAGKREIEASALPRTVDPEQCPVDGRKIVDGLVSSIVPSPGEGVYAEVLTAGGAQELEVRRLEDGTVELDHVGKESGEKLGAEPLKNTARTPGECGDPAFEGNDPRVEGTLFYRINWRTTPRDLSRRAAISAIRQAGGNVANTVNGCRMGDRVPAGIAYKGYTARYANRQGGSCADSDGLSVVSFGYLLRFLAVTCTYTRLQPGYDVVTSSDIKIDNTGTRWTTNPNSRSCRGRYDLEAVMTHERGHTFGLGHVSEEYHPYLTMGPRINGVCQSSERSLGRGDVLGLDMKYP